jgi:ParB-like chromosome segregation protein Spo0J
MPKLEDHPLACIFPLMGDADLDALAADIEANGQQEPVWLFEGLILDGRNRYRACVRKDVDQRVEHYKGRDPLGFVLSKNLHRRHLTESQRAMVAANIAGWKKGDNQHTAGGSANLPTLTQSQAAEQVSVSDRSVRDAVKVKADGVPELVKAVEAGDVSVSAAAEVAKLPKGEQKKAVKAGKVKEKAAEKRKEKQAKKDGPADAPGPDHTVTTDPAGEFVGRVNKLCHALDGAKKEAADIAAVPVFGRQVHGESVTLQIDAARKALWQARPTEPCNCVKGGSAPAANCKACFGAGLCPASRVLKGGR